MISPWICTKTFFLQNSLLISFIDDVKNGDCYVLKGKTANLWYNVFNLQDYDKINAYAIENNIEKELHQFLYELKQKNIIQINKKFPKSKKKYLVYVINKKSENFKYFSYRRSQLAVYNGFLNTIYLELNYKCNLMCKHCCNPKDKNEYKITYKNAKEIIDEAVQLGVSAVCITGGECTINKDFLKIAKYVRRKYLELYILTNGQILYDNKYLFNEVVNLYPSSVKVSLYSMNANIHDNITGVKGSHKKAISVIKKLQEKGVTAEIGCPILSVNSQEYEKVAEFAKSIEADYFIDNKFLNNPKNNNKKYACSQKITDEFYKNNFVYDKERSKSPKNNELVCAAGTSRLSITPELDITPCIYFNYILGNYKSVTLKEVKENIIPDFKKIFIKENLNECFNHEYCKYCTLCPTYASLNRGFMKRDKTLCMDAKGYYKAVLNSKEIDNT